MGSSKGYPEKFLKQGLWGFALGLSTVVCMHALELRYRNRFLIIWVRGPCGNVWGEFLNVSSNSTHLQLHTCIHTYTDTPSIELGHYRVGRNIFDY